MPTGEIPGLDARKGSTEDVLHAYVRQLITDFQLLPADQGEPEARLLVTDLIRSHAPVQGKAPPWTWDDAYALEKALARVEPIERIRRRIWAQRQEYRQLAGDRAFESYLASAPIDLAKASDEDLRSDLLQLLSEVQWLYSTIGVLHQVRHRLVAIVGWRSLLVLGLPTIAIVGGMYFASGSLSIPTLIIVMLCGALGGLISTYRRLQGMPMDGNPAVNLVVLSGSTGSTIWAPAFGAIFAAVFYCLMISGLVSGDLFPHLTTATAGDGQEGSLGLDVFLRCTGPKAGVDLAKLMIWAFLSGFAERLVPDTLDRIASSAEGSASN